MSIEPAASKGWSRLLFIDSFRGFAVLFMIEAHVTNATVLPELRKTEFFHYLNLFHGTISASFIFISGFAFVLTLQKKWDAFLQFQKPFFLQFRRLLFIIAIGYWLHLPSWSLQQILHFPDATVVHLLRADVLMLIGVSLLISLFVVVLVRNQTAAVLTLLLLGFTVVFTTPFIYDVDPLQHLPAWAGQYLNNRYRSLFPFFPWAAYSFFGSFLGWVYLRVKQANRERTFLLILATTGFLMAFSGFALYYVPWQYHNYVDVANASPRSFMLRFGFVFIWFSAIWLYERLRNRSQSNLAVLGQESLFIYGFHLLIVYGSVFTAHNFSRDIGPNLTFAESFLLTFLLIQIMAVLAFGWHWLKKNRPVLAKRGFYALCVIYFALLIFR
jgi:uncharacterized membrane protein